MKEPVYVNFDFSTTIVNKSEQGFIYNPLQEYQLQYCPDYTENEILQNSKEDLIYYCGRNKIRESQDYSSSTYEIEITSITLNEWGSVETYYDSCKASYSVWDPSYADIFPEEFYSPVYLANLSFTIRAKLYDKNGFIMATLTSNINRKDRLRNKKNDCGEPKINSLNGGVSGVMSAAVKGLRKDISKIIYQNEYKH